jgi:hypothetical protein
MRNLISVSLACLALGGAAVYGLQDRADRQLPELPAVPQRVDLQLLEVVPFELAVPERHTWRAEQPSYDQGYLLVLAAEPDRLVARQTYENVLYVGTETAERINVGGDSGHLVVLVPGPIDLENSPAFFGEPELPERVTASEAARQLGLARAEGVVPFRNFEVGAPYYAADGYELRRFASHLVERWSPDEADLITGLRAERIGR